MDNENTNETNLLDNNVVRVVGAAAILVVGFRLVNRIAEKIGEKEVSLKMENASKFNKMN